MLVIEIPKAAPPRQVRAGSGAARSRRGTALRKATLPQADMIGANASPAPARFRSRLRDRIPHPAALPGADLPPGRGAWRPGAVKESVS
jgi:hypothetical protein